MDNALNAAMHDFTFSNWHLSTDLCLLVVFTAILPSGAVHAQTQIRGTVYDAQSERPLPSANVFLEGTTYGTATDEEGRFSLADLKAGSYTLVVSMVGYADEQTTLRLSPPSFAKDTTLTFRFELQRRAKKLEGVTVAESRDTWSNRLDRFRSQFFGEVPYADSCRFVNPEVLSFEVVENGLIAHAEKPLRVRNEALGYEITYHLTQYKVSSDARYRYGKYEFDELMAESEEEREQWASARKRAYKGSFHHFVDALLAGTTDDNGFRMRLTTTRSFEQGPDRSSLAEPEPVEPEDIIEIASLPKHIVLKIPEDQYLEVQYMREDEAERFARRYRRRSPRSSQTSWVEIINGSKVLVNTRTGSFLAKNQDDFGSYFLTGYWGWYETAATALPGDYRPLGSS